MADDKDRKKLSDEEMEDVAGGNRSHQFEADLRATIKKDDKKGKGGTADATVCELTG